MDTLESTTQIIVAMIGQHSATFCANEKNAKTVASAFEIIYNKVTEMNYKPI